MCQRLLLPARLTKCSMTSTSRNMPGSEPRRFGYFLLQTRMVEVAGAAVLRPTVEDLSSGDKWDFDSASDLCRFLEALSDPARYSRWAPKGPA